MKRIYFIQVILAFVLFFLSVKAGIVLAACSDTFGTSQIDLGQRNLSNRSDNSSNAVGNLRNNNAVKLSKETILRGKKHRVIYTQGMDHAMDLVALGKKLRTYNVDPYITHIPEFADSILKHIDFIHQSLLSKKVEANDFNKKEGLDASFKILKEIKQEALRKIKNKQVTYDWNWKTNFYLSHVVEGSTHFQSLKQLHSLMESEGLGVDSYNLFDHGSLTDEISDKFPELIFIPTIEKIGIIAFNRSIVENIALVGLISGEEAHGPLRDNPSSFFDHDLRHGLALEIDNTELSNKLKEWYPKLEKKLESLSPQKREMMELIYFLSIHEDLLDGGASIVMEEILFDASYDERYEYAEFIPLMPKNVRSSKKKVIKHIKESRDLLLEILENAGFNPERPLFRIEGLGDVKMSREEILKQASAFLKRKW